MKPFEVGKTYKDTAGRDVRIVDDKYQGSLLLGIVSEVRPPGSEFIVCYNKNGNAVVSGVYNLIPEKEKVEGWVNVWRSSTGMLYFGHPKDTRRGAENAATQRPQEFVDIIKIEWQG